MKNKKSMLTDDKTRIGYEKGTEVKSVPTREELKITTEQLDAFRMELIDEADSLGEERDKQFLQTDASYDYLKEKLLKRQQDEIDRTKKAKDDKIDDDMTKGYNKFYNRDKKYSGGMLSDDKDRMSYAEGEEVETHMMPDGTEMAGATHGEYEEEMTMPAEEMAMPAEEMDMVPDKQMEQDHLDFIINESLDAEEETYLMEMLQADDRLSMIFDKVMDTASEFSGDGPVEGLGTGESDSIPARLSDGEFVMTAQATDEIGSDNLQNMMDGAEESSDYREQVAMGGEMQDKSQVDQFGKSIDKDLAEEEIRRSMLSVNPRLQ
jgi:hypothetical protein